MRNTECNLPIEILALVLDVFRRSLPPREFFRTISRCSRTSKLFYAVCSPYFFHYGVQIGTPAMDRRRIFHHRVSPILERCPSAEVYIQSLAYNYDFYQPKEVALHSLSAPNVLQLPNVTSISIRCDGAHALFRGSLDADGRGVFPVERKSYRLLLEQNMTAQTVTDLSFAHIRQIPSEVILLLPSLKSLKFQFCSMINSPSLSTTTLESSMTCFAATYTDFDPSFFRHCPNLEKLDVQGANPKSNGLAVPLTNAAILHDFCNLIEISTDCTLPWEKFLPPEPNSLFQNLRKLCIQLDDDGAKEVITGLLDRLSSLKCLSVDMDTVKLDTDIDLTRHLKSWRQSLQKMNFTWRKNNDTQLKVLCDALDLDPRRSTCVTPAALQSLELHTSLDLLNHDNIFDHDAEQWKRLDAILGRIDAFPLLSCVGLHINVNRICREIRQDLSSDLTKEWVVQYVQDWLGQIPLKNLMDSSKRPTLKTTTDVTSFALMFPGRDGDDLLDTTL
ncbi:hypothetical protein CVT24_006233 [Panaeolus cyanescens]|uniref:F-box domain-containing protein n=1 Tax=Panaeolus cyanescens TaxID=181874 RepID=A0A409YEF8_9AGAR|nr:hypothetical protein CVT24_006233 [Panaeolus cyanescens]